MFLLLLMGLGWANLLVASPQDLSWQQHKVQLELLYKVADSQKADLYELKSEKQSFVDSYFSREVYRAYSQYEGEKPEAFYKTFLAMDSQPHKLEVKGEGEFKVEYRLGISHILYENFVTGGSFHITTLDPKAYKRTEPVTLKGQKNSFDLAPILANVKTPKPFPIPSEHLQHCQPEKPFPCGIKVSLIELEIFKKVPFCVFDSQLKDDCRLTQWQLVGTYSLEVLDSYENEKNFYDRDLKKLRQ